MDRIRDYAGFALWFVGLGYIVLRLAGLPDANSLSPALHAVGLAAASFVAVRLALLALARRRNANGAPAGAARAPIAAVNPPPAPLHRLPTVKPRSEFGLRGKPR